MECVDKEYPNRSFDLTYFDSAGRSVLPQSVEAAGIVAVKQKSQPWYGVGSDGDIAEVRRLFSILIGGCDPSCVALNPSTGFAMSMAAANVVRAGVLAAGKHILIMDKEMGSVVYPWQEACNATGAALRIVHDPLLAGESLSWTDAIVAAVDETVAVVALPPVHWCSGALIDLHAVAARIAQLPAHIRPLFIVDGTQSLGAAPFDVCALEADFMACSVHKWLNCPYGMSLVYVHPRHHATWLPLDQHERGRVGSNEEGWDEIIFMDKQTGFYPEALFPDARRFDAGGKANPVTVPMVRAGLESVLRIGAENVERYTRALTNCAAEQLQRIFGGLLLMREEARRSAHILSVRFRPTSPLSAAASLVELNARLKQERVFASVRGEWLRLSLYVHNTRTDVRRFVSLFTLIAQNMLLQHDGSGGQGVRTAEAVGGQQVMTVLITGGAGWLAQSISESLLQHAVREAQSGPQYKVHVTYNNAVPHWLPVGRRHRVDLADGAAVTALVQRLKPDTIIHAAALSSPLVCHKDVRRAYAVNCPTALMDAVHAHVPDCLFLFTSTDMVYGGERAPYRAEDTSASSRVDAEQPANVYGQSKLACELVVRRLRFGTVLRLSNMIGAPYVYNPAGCKFLEWITGAFTRREFIGLKEREIRSFVYVRDVVEVVRRLMAGHVGSERDLLWPASAASGLVLNVGGPHGLSRLAVVRTLCEAAGAKLVLAAPPGSAVAAGEGAQQEAGDADGGAKDWAVYVMDSEPSVPSAAAAAAAAATGGNAGGGSSVGTAGSAGELVSPRDISMDCADTEQLVGMRFTAVDAALLRQLCL